MPGLVDAKTGAPPAIWPLPAHFTGNFTACLLSFTNVHSNFPRYVPHLPPGTMFSSVRVPRTVVEVWGLPS